jgi:hypothetical protein
LNELLVHNLNQTSFSKNSNSKMFEGGEDDDEDESKGYDY